MPRSEESKQRKRDWNKQYRIDNAEAQNARVKAWKDNNPLKAGLKIKAMHCRRKGGDVTPPQLLELWNKQNGLCALTGRKMLIRTNDHDPDCVSVDRIEAGLPYTISNLRLVTWQANAARGAWTDAQLLSFCKDVVKSFRGHLT